MIQFGVYHNVGKLYPDKDCILFLEDLVPGEGFHHLLMYSLLTVFSWVPVKRGSACS